jgi:hypothetical protein
LWSIGSVQGLGRGGKPGSWLVDDDPLCSSTNLDKKGEDTGVKTALSFSNQYHR